MHGFATCGFSLWFKNLLLSFFLTLRVNIFFLISVRVDISFPNFSLPSPRFTLRTVATNGSGVGVQSKVNITQTLDEIVIFFFVFSTYILLISFCFPRTCKPKGYFAQIYVCCCYVGEAVKSKQFLKYYKMTIQSRRLSR